MPPPTYCVHLCFHNSDYCLRGKEYKRKTKLLKCYCGTSLSNYKIFTSDFALHEKTVFGHSVLKSPGHTYKKYNAIGKTVIWIQIGFPVGLPNWLVLTFCLKGSCVCAYGHIQCKECNCLWHEPLYKIKYAPFSLGRKKERITELHDQKFVGVLEK